MKVLRVRLRSIAAMAILAALMLAFLYLPPTYWHNQFVPTASISPVAFAIRQDPHLSEEKIVSEKSEADIRNESEDLSNIEVKEEVLVPSVLPPDPKAQASSQVQTQEVPEDHHLMEVNENEAYVQDYNIHDYTPTGYVEVKKADVPSEPPKRRKIIPALGKNKKRPAKIRALSEKGGESSLLTPEVLQKRALKFANTSSLRVFLEEQERRVQHMAKMCIKGPSLPMDPQNRGMGPPAGLAGAHNLLVDRFNHIAFCPVYKAASTSWSIILLEIAGFWKKEYRKNQRLQTLITQVYPKISNFAGPSLTRGMTRFIVVRHPFERLLSCFRDKFEGAQKEFYYIRFGEKMVRRYRKFPEHITSSQLSMLEEQVRSKVKAEVPVVLPGNPFAEPLGPTFEEFVQYVITAKYDDEHWRPFYSHCSVCHVSFHYVLRFESMNAEGKEFIEYLNQTSQVHMRWENPTQGGSTTNDVICSYYSQLTKKMMDGLIRKYSFDFQLFEYKTDKYWKCIKDSGKAEEEEEEEEEEEKTEKETKSDHGSDS